VRSKLSVLVVDIGGSYVKLFSSAAAESAGFRSGPRLDPEELMRQVRQLLRQKGAQLLGRDFHARAALSKMSDAVMRPQLVLFC